MESSKLSNESHPRRDRRFSWTAIGFLFAFVLSVATVILTGLAVKAPGSHRQAPDAQAELTVPAPGRDGDVSAESDDRREAGSDAVAE